MQVPVKPAVAVARYRRQSGVVRLAGSGDRLTRLAVAAAPHVVELLVAGERIRSSSRSASRGIEHVTGWSIRKFVKTARRHRTIDIQAGNHVITAADPLPADLHQAIEAINASR